MAKLVLSSEEAVLCELVGVRTLLHARAVLADGEIVDAAVGAKGRAVGKVRAGGEVTGEIVPGVMPALRGACSCADAECVHVIALLIAAQQEVG